MATLLRNDSSKNQQSTLQSTLPIIPVQIYMYIYLFFCLHNNAEHLSLLLSEDVRMRVSIYPHMIPIAMAMLAFQANALPIGTCQSSSRQDAVIIAVITVASGVTALIFITLFYFAFKKLKGRISLSNLIPGEFDDELREQEEDDLALQQLSPNEQELYFQAKEYLNLNKTLIQKSSNLPLSYHLLIQDKAVKAWEFVPRTTSVRCSSRTEVSFCEMDKNHESSIQTNLPVPVTNEVYYFETKVYSAGPETKFSIGLASNPYPFFRLPGRHRTSVCYESDGSRRFNQPLPPSDNTGENIFPEVQRGDVIGVGYRTRSSKVFFTRNGKKLSESSIGGHVYLPKSVAFFPILGATGPCELHVNVGQSGYVFIEGNVKKWGFAPLEGNAPPPPNYHTVEEDVILERAHSEDSEEFPPDFFQATSYSDVDEEFTLNSLHRSVSGTSDTGERFEVPLDPPIYD